MSEPVFTFRDALRQAFLETGWTLEEFEKAAREFDLSVLGLGRGGSIADDPVVLPGCTLRMLVDECKMLIMREKSLSQDARDAWTRAWEENNERLRRNQ